jgi:3-oxoacyl-[acyl-carrier protein] reductase
MTDGEKALAGKTALVTGAGKGIGRAIALAYGKAGAQVACVSRTPPDLEELVKEIQATGSTGMALSCDVTKEEEVERVFAAISKDWASLDILVVNAGGNFQHDTVEDSDSGVWRDIVEVNLIAAYYCVKHAIPLLKRSEGGRIITTGSGMGHNGKPGLSAYAAAKAGLWMLTRVLSQELRDTSISVNELIPGPVETNQAVRGLRDLQTWRKKFEEMGEWLKAPEDVVPLAMFLATQPPGGPSAQSFSLMRRDT